MPVYMVKVINLASETIMVNANNKAAAINHVCRHLVDATPMTASQVVDAIGKGVPVETVSHETKQPELFTTNDGE